MNSIRKRDYDADLERLKTFIDSYHNNDPETGKKGITLQMKFVNWLKNNCISYQRCKYTCS